MKVLIVEECPFEGKYLAEMVVDQGYSVLGNVGSFKEADVLWRDNNPDLCIYDDKLESSSQNWQWLSEMISKKPLPLIVSAKKVRPEIRDCLDHYSHMPKPASTEDFKLAVSDSVVKFQKNKSYDSFLDVRLSDRMFIKDHMNNYKLVMMDDILWAKGEGNYTRIVTTHGYYLIRVFLGDFLRNMPADSFARIHKSYMINLRSVTEIRAGNVLIEDTEIPLAKSYRNNVLTRFQTY